MEAFFILMVLYFFLPVYAANLFSSLPGMVKFLSFLALPVDGGRKMGNQPIFGSHKTWRGVILGLTSGIAAVFFQVWLYQFPFFREISFLNYQEINIWLFAVLISGGAIFGDLLFAFIKRRLGLAPGRRFLPFDQTNYLIGAGLFLIPFFSLPWFFWPVIFVLTFFLHIVVTRLTHRLGLRENKW